MVVDVLVELLGMAETTEVVAFVVDIWEADILVVDFLGTEEMSQVQDLPF